MLPVCIDVGQSTGTAEFGSQEAAALKKTGSPLCDIHQLTIAMHLGGRRRDVFFFFLGSGDSLGLSLSPADRLPA